MTGHHHHHHHLRNTTAPIALFPLAGNPFMRKPAKPFTDEERVVLSLVTLVNRAHGAYAHRLRNDYVKFTPVASSPSQQTEAHSSNDNAPAMSDCDVGDYDANREEAARAETDEFSAEEIASEVWKPCHIDRRYEVSSLGRMRRDGKLRSPRVERRGALTMTIPSPRSRGSINYTVASLVLSSFGHQVPGGRRGRAEYLDGDMTNCRLSNLRWSGADDAADQDAPAQARSRERDRSRDIEIERRAVDDLSVDRPEKFTGAIPDGVNRLQFLRAASRLRAGATVDQVLASMSAPAPAPRTQPAAKHADKKSDPIEKPVLAEKVGATENPPSRKRTVTLSCGVGDVFSWWAPDMDDLSPGARAVVERRRTSCMNVTCESGDDISPGSKFCSTCRPLMTATATSRNSVERDIQAARRALRQKSKASARESRIDLLRKVHSTWRPNVIAAE
jgi:hypothetical protein